MDRNLLPLAGLALLALGACTARVRDAEVVVVEQRVPRPISIEIEVYDPISGYVWQDVGVRVVEAYHEWSGCVCATPYPEDWYYTGPDGIVFLSEYELAAADVGFELDVLGRAVISPSGSANEAVVTLEIWAPTFAPVYVDVDLTWSESDVFVSVPFE